MRAEALVGIDAEPDVGPCLADGAHAGDVEFELAGQLDLDGARLSVVARALRHDFRIVGAEREGGDQRPRSVDPGQAIGGIAGPAGLQLPHRAIDRVARAAGRQELAKLLAAVAGFDGRAVGLELLDDVRRVVAEIIDAARLAAAAMLAVGELDDDQVGGLEHIARDPERRGEPLGLDAIVQLPAHQ